MSNFQRAFVLLSVVFGLNGCALLPFDWGEKLSRPQVVSPQKPFVLNARVAISQDAQHHSADLRWTHKANHNELLFLAPLGKVVARIYQDQNRASFEDGEQTYYSETIEGLMLERLGWYLPVEYLQRWVLGDVKPAEVTNLQYDAKGRVSQFEHQSWSVFYNSYADDSQDSLPRRITIQDGKLRIKLVIDQWEWD